MPKLSDAQVQMLEHGLLMAVQNLRALYERRDVLDRMLRETGTGIWRPDDPDLAGQGLKRGCDLVDDSIEAELALVVEIEKRLQSHEAAAANDEGDDE